VWAPAPSSAVGRRTRVAHPEGGLPVRGALWTRPAAAGPLLTAGPASQAADVRTAVDRAAAVDRTVRAVAAAASCIRRSGLRRDAGRSLDAAGFPAIDRALSPVLVVARRPLPASYPRVLRVAARMRPAAGPRVVAALPARPAVRNPDHQQTPQRRCREPHPRAGRGQDHPVAMANPQTRGCLPSFPVSSRARLFVRPYPAHRSVWRA
jgi:hypothetical protein